MSSLVEGGVGVVDVACKMIKMNNEEGALPLNGMRRNRETKCRQ